MTRTTRIIAATAALAISALGLAAPASANHAPGTTGLYGSADPTYDGVYRQSFAIIGLTSNGVRPSPASITWLISQQCKDGSFQEFRTDTSKPCDAVDAVNGKGPDSNATSLALLALMSIDNTNLASNAVMNAVVKTASSAGLWLSKSQNPDGGWSYYAGSPSDSNSTGLALAALGTQAPNRQQPNIVRGSKFLASLITPCASADGGALVYQKGSKPDALSSAQGLYGLVGTAPVRTARKLGPAPMCAGNATKKIASYLSSRLSSGGTLASSFGDGPDYTATATAVVDLTAAGVSKAAVTKATNALKSAVTTYATPASGANAAALGLLLSVAKATGTNPKSFGGVNLITALQTSEQK
ncbi:MAG: prenyltransferase/squalene oxidase repeat-containing protein [Candidatus Nanopelagicales bacterium]